MYHFPHACHFTNVIQFSSYMNFYWVVFFRDWNTSYYHSNVICRHSFKNCSFWLFNVLKALQVIRFGRKTKSSSVILTSAVYSWREGQMTEIYTVNEEALNGKLFQIFSPYSNLLFGIQRCVSNCRAGHLRLISNNLPTSSCQQCRDSA